MIPTLATLALIASLVCTGSAIALYLAHIRRPARLGLRPARLAVYGAFAGVAAASLALWYLLVDHRFQVTYVYRYSALDMQTRYIVSAFWGGQEGTFLLWALFTGALAVVLRFRARRYEPWVQVAYLSTLFFLLLILVKRSPFVLAAHAPADGNGLNPLLQDPWMTIHPPVMFLGFAALAIPAAYAMAALVRRDWDDWIPRALPWTVLGVLTLGTGLTLGGYWSYSILGWGGYWGWDPVENSSLVPWLLAVALLHNQLIQLRTGRFRRANLLLAILPFLLLTYSTFLTRSGVLADFSVHSFTDLGINGFLVAFMAVFLAAGVGLWAFRFRSIPGGADEPATASRGNALFLGAAAFVFFAAVVCVGTSAPLLSRLWGGPAGIQPEFYDRAGLPFALLVCALLTVAPLWGWRSASTRDTLRSLRLPALVTLAAAPAFVAAGLTRPPHLALVLAATLALSVNVVLAVRLLRRGRLAGGGFLAHVGVGFMLVGITASTTLDRKELVEMTVGTPVEALGYTFTYRGPRPVEGGRKNAHDIDVRAGADSMRLSPTMHFSRYTNGLMKKPAIHSFPGHDLYVAPGNAMAEPVAHRVNRRLVLKQGETAEALGMSVRFDHFQTGTHAGEEPGTGFMEVAAHLTVDTGDTVVTLAPRLRTAPGRLDPGPATRIPGTSRQLVLDGVDATNGRVRLDVMAEPLVLAKGASGTLDGFRITFHDFDVDMGDGRSGMELFARVTARRGDWSAELRPGIVDNRGAGQEMMEAELPDGLRLAVTEVSPNRGEATFQVATAGRDALWAEVSTKPLVGLLWLGTGIVLAGLVLSGLHRARESRRADRRATGEPRRQAAAA